MDEEDERVPVIKVVMASRYPHDHNNKIYLNNEDITRYIKNINIDIGIDRVTTATIVLTTRAIIEAPAVLKAYIRKEDMIDAEQAVD